MSCGSSLPAWRVLHNDVCRDYRLVTESGQMVKYTAQLYGCGAEAKTGRVLGSSTPPSCTWRLERIGRNVVGGAQDYDTMHTRRGSRYATGYSDPAAQAKLMGLLSCPGGDSGSSLGLGRDAEPWELCQGSWRYAVRCWRRQPYASRPTQPGASRSQVPDSACARQLPALGAHFLFPALTRAG